MKKLVNFYSTQFITFSMCILITVSNTYNIYTENRKISIVPFVSIFVCAALKI